MYTFFFHSSELLETADLCWLVFSYPTHLAHTIMRLCILDVMLARLFKGTDRHLFESKFILVGHSACWQIVSLELCYVGSNAYMVMQ